jgi:hypothetical protein
VRWRADADRLLLEPADVMELRNAVSSAIEQAFAERAAETVRRTTSRHVSVVASPGGARRQSSVHVSLSLGSTNSDLVTLCQLAARAFPDVRPSDARFSAARVLHFIVPLPLSDVDCDLRAARSRGEALYGSVVRQLQLEEHAARPLVPVSPPPSNVLEPVARVAHDPASNRPHDPSSAARWYFGAGTNSPQR